MHYIGKVKFEYTDDNGKVKKKTRKYLVEAVSISDADYIIRENLGGMAVLDFNVSNIGEYDIEDYFTKDSAKKWSTKD